MKQGESGERRAAGLMGARSPELQRLSCALPLKWNSIWSGVWTLQYVKHALYQNVLENKDL